MDLKIFSGRSNEPLAREIVQFLRFRIKAEAGDISGEEFNLQLGILDEKRGFPDGELYVRYGENLRGRDVFIVQSTNQPHENDEELRMMIKTARSASAERVTAVIPYFGYARQDRKDKSRAPVSAVRKVIEYKAVGVDRLLVLDVHSSAVEIACEALDVRCDHLWARPQFVKYLRQDVEFIKFMQEGFAVAAPDLNAGKFARGYAEALGCKRPIALIEKRRDVTSGDTDVRNVIGDVADVNLLVVDDMLDTWGTQEKAVAAFRMNGAKRIFTLATHGLFSKYACSKIEKSPIERVYITNSINKKYLPSKAQVVSVAELLAEAIFRIHNNDSVSSLFE